MRKCRRCGKTFDTIYPTKLYCSIPCKRKGTRTRIDSRKRRRLKRLKKLILIYGHMCWYCGLVLDGRNTHIDHIIPKCDGGSDKIENLALACPFCNLAKNKESAQTFLSWLGRIKDNTFVSPLKL